MNQKGPSDSVIPGPGSNHSGVTFLTRNPTTGSAEPVVRYWIPAPQGCFLRGAFVGMTWLSIVLNMTDY